jgi:hypothetical protein
MDSTFALEIFAAAPWGDEPDAIPLVLEDYPLFGDVSPEQMRKVLAPVRLRLDAQGGLHALADAPLRNEDAAPVFIHHFDSEGKLLGKTPLHSAGRGPKDESFIMDYAVDADGSCYLLERTESQGTGGANNRLQKIGFDGGVRWSRTGPVSKDEFDLRELKGTFKRLLMDGRSRLYLPATEHAGAIAEIDRDTGDVAHVYISDKFSSSVFMDARGVVVYVLYFQDLNRRGLGFFDPGQQRVASVVGGDELYGWLLYPVGVDSSSNVYACKDAAVARIAADGSINVIAELDNVVVRSRDRAIFASWLHSSGEQTLAVRVTRFSRGEESSRRELPLPEELDALKGTGWKLIHVDEQERYYVFGGEAPGQAGTLLVYSKDGELEKTTSPPPDLLPVESRLESHSFWDVDTRGRVYLPVTDSQGFKVLRLRAGSGS